MNPNGQSGKPYTLKSFELTWPIVPLIFALIIVENPSRRSPFYSYPVMRSRHAWLLIWDLPYIRRPTSHACWPRTWPPARLVLRRSWPSRLWSSHVPKSHVELRAWDMTWYLCRAHIRQGCLPISFDTIHQILHTVHGFEVVINGYFSEV